MKRLIAAAVALALATAWGCASEEPDSEPKRVVNLKIPPAQIDTMSAWKVKYNVDRDEYWDNRGGVVANSYVEAWYPAGTHRVAEGMIVIDEFMKARAKLTKYCGSAPDEKVKVVVSSTMPDYEEKTKRNWWLYADIDDNEIVVQPVGILNNRGLVTIALPKIYYEWAFDHLTDAKAPQWVISGIAGITAGEVAVATTHLQEFPDHPVKMSLKDIEAALKQRGNKESYRIANYNAIRMVDRINLANGPDKLARTIALMSDGKSRDAAFQEAFGKSYNDVATDALAFTYEK